MSDINKLFYGRYNILRQIGKGGMGKVYLAENLRLGTLWAIKQISKRAGNNMDFITEANILKKLNHPSIVKIYDIDEDSEYIYIVEEYIEGVSVEQILKQVPSIDEAAVIEWCGQICDALDYLHSLKPNPIIYRDMKPSNIMVTSDNKIKLIDFGIAREYKEYSAGDTTYTGTRGYAAPEQYGSSQTDARTDIYSLGVTLYHMVTGLSPNDPPYEIQPIRQINPDLSQGLEHIILTCTKLNPMDRYQNMKELIYDLNRIDKFNYEYKKKVLMSWIKAFSFALILIVTAAGIYGGITQYRKKQLEKYNETIQVGIQYTAEKQYDLALVKYNEALKQFPKKIDSYKEIAKLYLKQGDSDKCISYIQNEVLPGNEEATKSAELYYVIGTAYFNKNDYKNAVVNFTRCEDLDGGEVIFKRDLGVSLARMGEIESAERKLQEIQNKNLSEEVSWYVYGEILAAKKSYTPAVESFVKCLEASKDEDLKLKAYISAAQIYSNNTKTIPNALDSEIALLEKSASDLKEKNNVQIMEMLGSAYYAKGLAASQGRNELLSKSASYFNSLLNLGYRRPYIYRNIAIIYQQCGDFDNSLRILNEMRSYYPEEFRCYLQLALLYADMEGKKPNERRNYTKTDENYKLAVKFAPEGEKTPELQPLIKLIEDLRKYKWIQ